MQGAFQGYWDWLSRFPGNLYGGKRIIGNGQLATGMMSRMITWMRQRALDTFDGEDGRLPATVRMRAHLQPHSPTEPRGGC